MVAWTVDDDDDDDLDNDGGADGVRGDDDDDLEIPFPGRFLFPQTDPRHWWRMTLRNKSCNCENLLLLFNLFIIIINY